MREIIKFWRKLDINTADELIHPEDISILKNVTVNLSFDDYVGNCDNLFGNNFQIHTGLIPAPYAGDLENAKIFLLMINPGLAHNCYYSEKHCQDYKDALINNLRQENLNPDYPFLYLNPKFCHTSGGNYWLKKFNGIIRDFHTINGYTYENAIKLISKNVCTIELFPYHSKNFRLPLRIIRNCPSIIQIRGFVTELLEENERDVLVYCVRRPEDWMLNDQDDNKRLKILPRNQRQSASFATTGSMGQNILKKLLEIGA